MSRVMIPALALVFLAACGGENNENNGATNNGATNNGATNNGATNNGATNNGATNNGATNNGATNNGTTGTNNGTVPCGAVTDDGMCTDDSTYQYCDPDFGLVEVSCPENFGAGSTCTDVEGYADCTVPPGGVCEEYDDVEDISFLYTCGGTDPACILDDSGDSVCVENIGVCDSADFVEICSGDIYLYDCVGTQPLGADCGALGGTCDDTQGCVLPAGSTCDDLLLICEDGTQCNIPSGEREGTCE